MEEITKKVSSVRKRLFFHQSIRYCGWALFGCLIVAAIGLAVPKIWFISIDAQTWVNSWIIGACAIGLTIGFGLAYSKRAADVEAAAEIDRRFGLKERVASALSLSTDEQETSFGQALIEDATRRVERIEIGDSFDLRPKWHAVLPLVPVALLVAVLFVENADSKEAEADQITAEEAQRIKDAAQKLKREFEKKKKELAEKGLEKLDAPIKKMEEAINELQKGKDVDKQKALVKLNDVAKELSKKREGLGGVEELHKQLKRMKDMAPGPADKMMQAMKKGDFQAAANEVKKMQQKMARGELSDADKKKLAKQLSQMKKSLERMQQRQQEAAESLRNQIAEKKKQGDLASAGQLQRQLDKMNAQQGQMQQMQQMANQMQKAMENLEQGDAQQASQNLQQVAQDLQQMANEMDQLESIDQMLSQIDMASASMNGSEQEMEPFGDGEGSGQGEGEGDGDGNGEGEGKGYRDESRTEYSAFDSKVRQNVRKGETTKTGIAAGPNAPGISREELKAQIQSEFNTKAEPIDNQQLPKFQRNHAKEYFDEFLK